MNIWEELANLKGKIPKDAMIYEVVNRYDNILMKHRIYIERVYWNNYNIGLIDAPLDDHAYGVYSTKEKAISEIKKRTKNYTYPVELIIKE